MATTEITDTHRKQIIEIARKCKADFLFFCDRYLKVQTTRGEISHFKLNGPQRIIHNIIEKEIKPKRRVRIVALKARRMGFSTYFSARYYYKTSWQRNRYATQITHEPEATAKLFEMVKRFYDFCPKWLRPETKYNNAKTLDFNTKDGQGLNSGFRVATAAKEDFGSGQLLTYCHLSEVSKWDAGKAKDLLTAILQCVPNDDESEVVFESTAKGVGGEFYDRFWGARYRIWVKCLNPKTGLPVIETKINETAEKENEYTSIFLPWFCFEDYVMTPPPGFKLTPEEAAIKERFGLSDRQAYWRRWCVANNCSGNEDLFAQEYPACPEEAFLTSGRPIFDNVKIAALKEAAPKPLKRMEFDLSRLDPGGWYPVAQGRLKVWEEPVPGEAYIIGADVAEGLSHGDFSVAQVINHRTGVQVAEWHGHLHPDQFARILYSLGLWYNTAWIGPERNNHGLTVVVFLQSEFRYPRIYVERIPDPPGRPRERYGWLTDLKTRPMILDLLIREVREGIHGIRCAELFEEMLSFKSQDNGKMEADPGRHDDRVLAYAIAKQLRQILAPPVARKPAQKRPGGLSGRGKPAKLGWT